MSLVVLLDSLAWPVWLVQLVLPSWKGSVVRIPMPGVLLIGLLVDCIILFLLGWWADRHNRSLKFYQKFCLIFPAGFVLILAILFAVMFVDPSCWS